jgi:hypothetical protein
MLLSGLIVLVIGMSAFRSGEPVVNVLFLGLGLSFFGFLLWNKLREKKRRSTRFSLFRKRDQEDRDNEEPDRDDGWNF